MKVGSRVRLREDTKCKRYGDPPPGTLGTIISLCGTVDIMQGFAWNIKWDDYPIRTCESDLDLVSTEDDVVSFTPLNISRFKRDVRDTLARWRTPNQVSGTHYSDLVVEPNDYAILNDLDPIQHNVIKYVTRAKSEDDLDKAISQIQRLKEYKFGRK